MQKIPYRALQTFWKGKASGRWTRRALCHSVDLQRRRTLSGTGLGRTETLSSISGDTPHPAQPFLPRLPKF